MKLYPHDRLMARLVLPAIPKEVTPNQVTLFRLFATPFVVWLIYAENYTIGIPAFILAAFTDVIDGSLARVRNQVTQWGMVWDPVMDKILIGSVVVVMLMRHFPPELTIIILGLEAVFLASGYYRKRQGKIVSANIWGKFKMFHQAAGVFFFLLSLALGMPVLAWISYVVLAAAVVFAVISLFRHSL